MPPQDSWQWNPYTRPAWHCQTTQHILGGTSRVGKSEVHYQSKCTLTTADKKANHNYLEPWRGNPPCATGQCPRQWVVPNTATNSDVNRHRAKRLAALPLGEALLQAGVVPDSPADAVPSTTGCVLATLTSQMPSRWPMYSFTSWHTARDVVVLKLETIWNCDGIYWASMFQLKKKKKDNVSGKCINHWKENLKHYSNTV